MTKNLSKVIVYGFIMAAALLVLPRPDSFAGEQVQSDDLMIYGSPRIVQGIYVCDGAPTSCQHPFHANPTQPITPVDPGTTT
ncbi:MAG: hypothetical protein EOO20_01060 [Chryseobacterium sp.]|nr:MAG: hypothetical protein EOO20_01060 [Chryseobacterium sp.]